VLRSARLRGGLWRALEEVERLVLLGDTLELRHGPRGDAIRAARPFFEELGSVFAGREVVLVPGNHDHALIAPWLERRAELQSDIPLGLERRLSPDEASEMLDGIARSAAPAQMTVAYPGLWVREDVYATHGHYLDCHQSIPTLERLGIAATGRVLGRAELTLASTDDYEAVTAPVNAWIDSVAQSAAGNGSLSGQGTLRAWRALQGVRRSSTARSWLRSRMIRGAFPLAVAALNRAGLGRFQADISGEELRRAGLRAMGEVGARLGLAGGHLVFGHTHRAGPLAYEHEPLWVSASAVSMVNCGSWTYEPHLVNATPARSPYWPGGSVIVEDGAAPRLERLLDNVSRAELQSATEGG
jgi:hypothetical protein